MITNDKTDGRYFAGGFLVSPIVSIIMGRSFITDGQYVAFVGLYLAVSVGLAILFRIGAAIWEVFLNPVKSIPQKITYWILCIGVLTLISTLVFFEIITG